MSSLRTHLSFEQTNHLDTSIIFLDCWLMESTMEMNILAFCCQFCVGFSKSSNIHKKFIETVESIPNKKVYVMCYLLLLCSRVSSGSV